ncbi:MAG: anti-sigma factor [Opitutaceae bacterium]
MMDEHHEELAALYALDLLEGEEKAAFERALLTDAALRARVAELRETSSQLAFVAGDAEPSADLRRRVLASATARSTSTHPAPVATVIPIRPFLWIGWGIAAALTVGSFWLGQRYLSTHRELSEVRTLVAVEQADARSLRNQLEAERLIAQRQTSDLKKSLDELASTRHALSEERSNAARQLAELQARTDLANFKVARLASLLGNSPEAAAIAVWNPITQEGVLTVEKLPALASNQDYQLWVIDPQYTNPVDGGVFTVDASTGVGRLQFRPKQPVAQATKFAISREKKGGVPKAEGPIVLLSH